VMKVFILCREKEYEGMEIVYVGKDVEETLDVGRKCLEKELGERSLISLREKWWIEVRKVGEGNMEKVLTYPIVYKVGLVEFDLGKPSMEIV